MLQEYFPTIALSALKRVLVDANQSVHHNMVLQSIMLIFQSLRSKCVTFLPQLVPQFLTLAKTRESNLRESFVQLFEILVRMAKQSIRPYLPSLFGLCRSIWPDCLTQLLKLIETVAEVMDGFPVLLYHESRLLLFRCWETSSRRIYRILYRTSFRC